MFFSATYSPQIINFIKQVTDADRTIKIELPKEKLTLKGIKQYYICAKRAADDPRGFNPKLRLLRQLIETIDTTQVIVFVNTKVYVNNIYRYLTNEGYTCDKIMGGMTPVERDQVMRQFRLGDINFLIATDLLSRGIDISGMNMVINFDVPYKKDKDGFYESRKAEYLHRIGRTGRFDTKGAACTLVGQDDYDNEMAVLLEIQEHYKSDIVRLESIEEFYDNYKEWVDAED